jgi:hypothetical protein
LKEGSGNNNLSRWALCEVNLEGDSVTGDPGGYVEKALEMGIFLHRGCTGEPGRGLVYRDFER